MIINQMQQTTLKGVKARDDRVEKVFHWELCKKLDFKYSTKWYTHKQESLFQNMTHKILWNFEIQTDHLIPARRPNQMLINKRKRTGRLVKHRVKMKESERIDKYLDLDREQKQIGEQMGDGHTNISWCAWNVLQSLRKEIGIIGNRKKKMRPFRQQYFLDRPEYSDDF